MRAPLPFALALALTALPAAAEVHVIIDQPSGREAIFGEIDITATIISEEAPERVDFIVDGRLAGSRTAPPWTVRTNVGEENIEHQIQVVARTATGREGAATLSTPKIQVDMEVKVALQELYVTVTRGGDPALDLGRSDFEVLDEGKRQQIVTFDRGDVPLTAVLLVDSSESMKGDRMEAALSGAMAFVRDVQPRDEAMVMLFSDRLLRATPFTNQPEVLARSLRGVQATGGTALNDHLYLAVKLLESRVGRRVVVILSDGADVLSALRMQEVLWKIQRSQALVYWIRLEEAGLDPASFTSAWRNVEANRREFDELATSVADSGARIVSVKRVADVVPAFGAILQELRQQYVLGFQPSERRGDGSWHRLDVRVERLGHKVRARDGYVDF